MDLDRAPEPWDGTVGCREYAALPCTREAIEDYTRRRCSALGLPPPNATHYPDEYYADKNNRLAGRPTGHLRCLVSQGGKMVWVAYSTGPAAEQG